MARTVVLTDDLFFRVKIETVARAAGADVGFTDDPASLGEAQTVLVDLNHRRARPIETIGALKALPEPPVVIAFGSHQDRAGLKGARDAGADRVMARSTFVENLAQLLGEASEIER